MLDLHRMQILHRFAASASIAATAASLGYSASAISQQLALLERETGAVLLERTARSARLTDAGRLLAEHAGRLLDLAATAEADLAALEGTVSGRLIVSAIPSVATGVAAALADVQRHHRGLDIVMRETVSEPAVQAVVDHLSDIAIIDDWDRRPAAPMDGLTRTFVTTEPVVLAVPARHRLAGQHDTLAGRELAAAVADMTWLCAPTGHTSRAATDRLLASISATPRRRWEFEGLITIAELVAAGAGCALLPQTVAATQKRSRLRTVAITPRLVRHTHAFTRSAVAMRPAIALCLESIIRELGPTVSPPADRPRARPRPSPPRSAHTT